MQPRCPSIGEKIKCGIFRKWNMIQHKKERAIKPQKDKEEP